MKTEKVITFRVDNDDAVQSTFIETLRRYGDMGYDDHVLTMPNILIVKRQTPDQYKVEKRHYPCNSIGLAYVSSRSKFRTIFDLGHHANVNTTTPVIVLPDGYGGVQTINGENAVNDISRKHSVLWSVKELNEHLLAHNLPSMDMTCLRPISEFTEITHKVRKRVDKAVRKSKNLYNAVLNG